MWRVLFILTVLTANCEPFSKKPKTVPSRNQRIIKVQGPPHFNHFYGHKKPVRKRPFGPHHGDEFIRPNFPPPIPPFFNGPSTNHIKHLPRPPPHVFHKSPSYGLGFPYKSLSNYRPTITKDQFRIQTISTIPLRGTSGSTSSSSISSSTTYHSPTFTSSNSFVSSPVSHIISSDDNNGPIREIPAPNLAPKPHHASFGTLSVLGDGGGIDAVSGFGGVGNIGAVGGVLHGVGDISGGSAIHGISDLHAVGGIQSVSGVGVIQGGLVGSSGIQAASGSGDIHADLGGSSAMHEVSGGAEIHSNLGGSGGIHGVSATAEDISNIASVGGVTHLEPEALLHTVGKNPGGVNLDMIVKDQGLEVNTYIKESGGDVSLGKEPTVEIANFDGGSSIDVTNLVKDAAGESDHHSGYEVTEHHNHLPSNDQIIKGHDGTKLYYAPDPDPSLPVHKVPPTNDPHSTPSNGQKTISSLFLPQVSHGFPHLQGGSVGGHLSSQEIFQLMHGYPAVISQPVVAFVGQPQAPGVILPGAGQNYYQQGYAGGHYAQNEQGNDISQYLQQPEIHNLLHNSGASQDTIGGSHSSVVSQSIYSPRNQYQSYIQSQYQTSKSSGLESNSGDFAMSEINHNYQYEPEASETNNRNSLTVIRQVNSEGVLNSGTVKELLLEDSAANEINHRKAQDATPATTILHLKNIPEVPFYATLPSKKAAEALATLQAAGSVASNYINKIKISRGGDKQGRRRQMEDGKPVESEAIELGSEKTIVEIQESLPVYETNISSKNLIDNDLEEQEEGEEVKENVENDGEFSSEGQDELDDFNFKENEPNETFGSRAKTYVQVDAVLQRSKREGKCEVSSVDGSRDNLPPFLILYHMEVLVLGFCWFLVW